MEDYQGMFSKRFNIPDIENLFDGLSICEQEWLAQKLFEAMTIDSKSKIINQELSDSGLVVVLSSCEAVCHYIKNSSNRDIATILQAIASRGIK